MTENPSLADENPKQLIAQMILECKGQGNFLPYVDYEIIDQWLKASANVEELLVILSDVLPEFYSKSGKKQLSGANKLVMACIKDRAMRIDR